MLHRQVETGGNDGHENTTSKPMTTTLIERRHSPAKIRRKGAEVIVNPEEDSEVNDDGAGHKEKVNPGPGLGDQTDTCCHRCGPQTTHGQ